MTAGARTAATSPFARPNGGAPTPLVGRERELEELGHISDLLASDRSARGLYFRGCRGIGKTVLLERYLWACRARGWLVVWIRGGDFVPRAGADDRFGIQVLNAVNRAIEALDGHRAGRGVGGGTKVGARGRVPMTGVDLEFTHEFGKRGPSLAQAADRLSHVRGDYGVPVVFLVDEADFIGPEEAEILQWLGRSLHWAYDNEYPTTLVAAGTVRTLYRTMRGIATDGDWSGTPHNVKRLNDATARRVLIETAAVGGEDWSAVDWSALVSACAGIPRRLQAAGDMLWSESGPIDSDSARKAATRISEGVRALLHAANDHEGVILGALSELAEVGSALTLPTVCSALARHGVSDQLHAISRAESLGLLDVEDDGTVSVLF